MHTKLVLGTDILAIELEDKVTLMVDLTAPEAANSKERPPRGVQICLDVSGSMDGAPLKAAKESILRLVDRQIRVIRLELLSLMIVPKLLFQ